MITHIVRRIWWIHSLSVEEEATALDRLALPLAESIHELLQLSRALNLEEDFIVVIRHFDIDVAWLLRLF